MLYRLGNPAGTLDRFLYINTEIPDWYEEDQVPTSSPSPSASEVSATKAWIIFSIPFLCLFVFMVGMLFLKRLRPSTAREASEENDVVEIPTTPQQVEFLETKLNVFFAQHFEREGNAYIHLKPAACTSLESDSDSEWDGPDKSDPDTETDDSAAGFGPQFTGLQPCAVCLEDYQAGDTLITSCHAHCPHVFHKKCILSCLTSIILQKALAGKSVDKRTVMACPCCRQAFCTLSAKEKKELREIMASKAPTQEHDEEV